jgi:adenylate cyclase
LCYDAVVPRAALPCIDAPLWARCEERSVASGNALKLRVAEFAVSIARQRLGGPVWGTNVQFLFADYRLDIGRRELRRGSEPIAVEPQVLDVLIYLVQNRDRVVSKDDLIASVWGGRIVSDATLTSRIYAVRKAIGDSGERQDLIRTVARKGLRFVGTVHTQSSREAPAPAAGTPPDEPRAPLALPEKPSIAVLPFQDMSGDLEQCYFTDGVVEEITSALSRVRSFFVIARNSAFTYKGRSVDVKQVSRELGVRYVLEGSFRRDRRRVRITAQLIDATTGNHIWSDRYDGGIEDIFDLQDRITESVVGAIQPSILLAEIERIKRKRPESLDAYDHVLRAFPHVWALDEAANATALDHLSRAIEIERDYPLALALAAWCQARKITYNWTSALDETKAEGLRLARLAGGMQNDDPLVLTMLCAAHSVIGDLDVASALIEKALALDPNSAMAWNRSGWLNTYLIRPEIAIEHFRRAIRLSPFDPMNFNCILGIGNAHFAAGRYEEALSWWRKGMLERPDLTWPLRPMAASLGLLGRISEAREAVRQLRQGYPDITISKIMAIVPHRGDYARRYAEGLRKAGLPE